MTNTFNEAMQWYQHESAHPSQSWLNMCQSSVRHAWGLPGGFSSAWAQWLGADDDDKHPGGNPNDAPLGAALCYKGSSPYGHIVTKARPFTNHNPAVWSNDLVRSGHLDKVAPTAAVTKWGQKYLGYLTAVNNYDLNLPEVSKSPATAKPKPKDTQQYQGIQRAINHLDDALGTAKGQHDAADVKTLSAEIQRLQHLYSTLRRS